MSTSRIVVRVRVRYRLDVFVLSPTALAKKASRAARRGARVLDAGHGQDAKRAFPRRKRTFMKPISDLKSLFSLCPRLSPTRYAFTTYYVRGRNKSRKVIPLQKWTKLNPKISPYKKYSNKTIHETRARANRRIGPLINSYIFSTSIDSHAMSIFHFARVNIYSVRPRFL